MEQNQSESLLSQDVMNKGDKKECENSIPIPEEIGGENDKSTPIQVFTLFYYDNYLVFCKSYEVDYGFNFLDFSIYNVASNSFQKES